MGVFSMMRQFQILFFLSWLAKTQPNHRTKWVASTRLTTVDPTNRQMLPYRTENANGFLPVSHVAPDHLQDQANLKSELESSTS